MVLYLVMAVLFGVLFFLSSKMEVLEKQGWRKLLLPITKMAWWISGKIYKGKEKQRKRNIEKWELVLIILFSGMVLLPVMDKLTTTEKKNIESEMLHRPDKGEGSIQYHIQAQVGEKETPLELTVNLDERQYSLEEKEDRLREAEKEIDRIVLGENESPEAVRGQVILPGSVLDGDVSIQWMQDPQDLLDENGMITEELPPNGEVLVLTALMDCDGEERSYEFALHLMPLIRTEEEQLQVNIQKALQEAGEESVSKSEMKLPDKVDDQIITWSYPRNSMTGVCFAVILLLAVAGYIGKTQEYVNEDAYRRRQILMDYPDLVFKLGMLLSAGLTIQNAFTKVAAEYKENRTGKKKDIRYAYEEMYAACNEMKSGVSEAKAYENFGRRCEAPCYIRLGNTLAGGLQKSAEGLTDLLLKEADRAMEDRRQLARKLGEEAGTKLVFPMILMLMIVMVILMVPALISF